MKSTLIKASAAIGLLAVSAAAFASQGCCGEFAACCLEALACCFQ